MLQRDSVMTAQFLVITELILVCNFNTLNTDSKNVWFLFVECCLCDITRLLYVNLEMVTYVFFPKKGFLIKFEID